MKQRKRELSEHHFSNSSIIFPNQEIGGCAAIRTENMSQRFVIHTETWEFGTVYLGPSRNARVAYGTLIDSGYRDALVFNYRRLYHF